MFLQKAYDGPNKHCDIHPWKAADQNNTENSFVFEFLKH